MKWNPAYTPGPWKVEGSSGLYSVNAFPHGLIASIRYLGNADKPMAQERANVEVMALAPEMAERLHAVDRFFREVLPKFNWGASALDAKAIRTLNELPGEVAKLLARIPQKGESK